MQESRAVPVVAVEVWYAVGTRDDPAQRPGLAHLAEHAMGQGSANVRPGQLLELVQRNGGLTNANTTEDRTAFYTVAPSNMLETLLWLESDRMLAPLDGLTPEIEAAQWSAVWAEHATREVGGPVNALNEWTPALLFPPGHPYHLAHIDSAVPPIAELRAFARAHYVPENAVLAIAGDFDVAGARALVEKYFGSIPAARAPSRAPARATRPTAGRRVAMEDARTTVGTERLRMAWTAPSTRDPDAAAMRMLARILGAPRSPLRQALTSGAHAPAASLAVTYADLEESGIFQIDLTATDSSVALSTLEELVDSAITSLRASAPDEALLRRARNDTSVAAVVGLQLTKARADLLAAGLLFYGDAGLLFRGADAFAALTPSDIRSVAERYLGAPHLTVSVVARQRLDRVSRPSLPFERIVPR